MEKLGTLKTAFKEDGVITAGNASQISDGAAALLMTTSGKSAELGLRPMARVHTVVLAGGDPVIMLTAPIPATQKALQRSGLSIDEIGAFEVNESFARCRWPGLPTWAPTPRRSTPTAARLRSATRWAAPVPG